MLFLGPIRTDDETGTIKRIKTARSAYGGQLGVATECRMGRTPVDDIKSIFAISETMSLPYRDTGRQSRH